MIHVDAQLTVRISQKILGNGCTCVTATRIHKKSYGDVVNFSKNSKKKCSQHTDNGERAKVSEQGFPLSLVQCRVRSADAASHKFGKATESLFGGRVVESPNVGGPLRVLRSAQFAVFRNLTVSHRSTGLRGRVALGGRRR